MLATSNNLLGRSTLPDSQEDLSSGKRSIWSNKTALIKSQKKFHKLFVQKLKLQGKKGVGRQEETMRKRVLILPKTSA